MVEYGVVEPEDVQLTDLSEVEEVHPDLNIRQIDRSLGLEKCRVKLWYFEPGDEFRYHAHAEQEEVYYVMRVSSR